MSIRLQVLIYENRHLVESAEFDGPVELGRQRDREEGLFTRNREKNIWRWVVARRDEVTVGRSQMLVEPLSDGRVRLTNGSDRQPIRFQDRGDLQPQASLDITLPTVIVLSPSKSLRLANVVSGQVNSLADRTMPPRSAMAQPTSRLPSLIVPGGQVSAREMIDWLHSAMDVLQAAADSDDFFDRAARAAVDTVSLDAVRVLLLEGEVWKTRTVQNALNKESGNIRPPSHSVLDRVRADRKTTWEVFTQNSAQPDSLHGVETVVAAPILSREGTVLGALYGERGHRPRLPGLVFGDLEASLVELLARGVAAGLARIEEERRAIAASVQFEQFFTADLARKLLANPQLLEGRDREVTVMFCDIRGFSRISELLGAERTISWCRDVLDVLSECVLAEGGVLVDYVGDGLMAMWGAPDDQPDHPMRACQAAQAILSQLPELSARWETILGEPVVLGIGINTGSAQVGNVGSRHKFKYGALGTTVNLASRVQGATKFFKCKVLLTRQTQARLDESIVVRRLARVRMHNLHQPVDLFELLSPDWPLADQAREEYGRALELFEQEKYSESARTLGNWRSVCPQDDSVLLLLSRAVDALVKGRPSGHPVWEFTEK